MSYKNEYVKYKINMLIDGFYELNEQLNSLKGQTIRHASIKWFEKDIDQDYKLRVSYAGHWQIVIKESAAVLTEVWGVSDYPLGQLMNVFTDSVIDDYNLGY